MISGRENAVVLPVMLLRSGTHLDAVRAVAVACLSAYLSAPADEERLWREWLDSDQAKSVRRARGNEFGKVLGKARHTALATVGEARAAAFAPVSYVEMDPLLRRLQVNGTDFDRVPVEGRGGLPTIVLNAGLSMSTGKSAAQAGHAVLEWWGTLSDKERQAHQARGFEFNVREVPAEEFERLGSGPGVAERIIHDAGHTEIESGSATAFVLG